MTNVTKNIPMFGLLEVYGLFLSFTPIEFASKVTNYDFMGVGAKYMVKNSCSLGIRYLTVIKTRQLYIGSRSC